MDEEEDDEVGVEVREVEEVWCLYWLSTDSMYVASRFNCAKDMWWTFKPLRRASLCTMSGFKRMRRKWSRKKGSLRSCWARAAKSSSCRKKSAQESLPCLRVRSLSRHSRMLSPRTENSL